MLTNELLFNVQYLNIPYGMSHTGSVATSIFDYCFSILAFESVHHLFVTVNEGIIDSADTTTHFTAPYKRITRNSLLYVN